MQWARQLGQMTDQPVRVPLHSCELTELITKPLDGIDANMPGGHFNAEFVVILHLRQLKVHCSVDFNQILTLSELNIWNCVEREFCDLLIAENDLNV